MKILFIGRNYLYFRNYESGLRELAARGHRIHFAAEKVEKGGEHVLAAFAREADRFTYAPIPEPPADRWRALSRRLRLGIDYLRYLDPIYDEAPLRRVRAWERTSRALIALASPPLAGGTAWRRAFGAWLHRLDAAVPPPPATVEYIRAQAPDIVLITPLVDLGSQQIDFVRAARSLGIPTGLCVWSWDHLSSKALLREPPERIFVWNATQKREAIEVHGVPADRVVVTGAACFDHWFDRRPSRTREEFCREVGLPADRPIVLYVCTGLIAGSPSEQVFVREWLEQVRGSADPRLRSAGVLVRPHPVLRAGWDQADFGGLGPVAVWGGASPIDAASRADYFDSLYHATAVVGLNTSAFIEAGIVGRQVLAILPPRFYDNQEGTVHFKYLLEIGGGLLRVSRDFDTHLAQLGGALALPPSPDHPHRAFLESFVRPSGLEQPATPAFADAVEAFAGCVVAEADARQDAPWWRRTVAAGAARLVEARAAEALVLSPREIESARRVRAARAAKARAARARSKALSTARKEVRSSVKAAARQLRTARAGALRVAALAKRKLLSADGRASHGGPAGKWAAAALVTALLAGVGLSYFLVGIPVQLSDCVGNLYSVIPRTYAQILVNDLGGSGYIRPLLWAQFKLVYDVSGGHYFATFKAVHVAQLLACVLLFAAALRVRSSTDFVVVPVGLAMLLGSHTFSGTIREAFPVNSFLTVVASCLGAAALSLSVPRRWHDAAALLLFASALFTVESGALVFVCLAAAWLTGARGVSGRAVAGAGAILAVYLTLRFVVLDVATPGLMERSSGFGFRMLDPTELTARFRDAPLVFYAYNVMSQVLTVLFAEPRGGVWSFTDALRHDAVLPRQWIAVVTSTGSTLAIAWYLIARRRIWRHRRFDEGDRLVAMFGAILLANAVLSFPYTKTVIVSPAGAFHALAACVALRALLDWLGRPERRGATVLACSLLLGLLSAGWAVRFVGIHYSLRYQSFVTRNDWVDTEGWLRRNAISLDGRPEEAALLQALRDDAIARRRAPALQFANPRLDKYFDVD